MNFGCYYDPNAKGADRRAHPRRLLASRRAAAGRRFPIGDYCGMGENVVYTGHHYGAFNTEPRIASYIGIALGQIPAEHYFGRGARSPTRATGAGRSSSRSASGATYLGVDVFEGAYRYDDQLVVPTWGGSMFEALMAPLVVPEEEWGPHELGGDPSAVRRVADRVRPRGGGLRLLGVLAASNPAGGYREYGVDAIGMEPNGYAADVERLTISTPAGTTRVPAPGDADHRLRRGRGHAARRLPRPRFAPDAALDNLETLAADFPGLYGRGGFKDSVNVATGQVADRYLALDQGMVIAAIANELTGDRLPRLPRRHARAVAAPLMAIEEFGAGRCEHPRPPFCRTSRAPVGHPRQNAGPNIVVHHDRRPRRPRHLAPTAARINRTPNIDRIAGGGHALRRLLLHQLDLHAAAGRRSSPAPTPTSTACTTLDDAAGQPPVDVPEHAPASRLPDRAVRQVAPRPRRQHDPTGFD